MRSRKLVRSCEWLPSVDRLEPRNLLSAVTSVHVEAFKSSPKVLSIHGSVQGNSFATPQSPTVDSVEIQGQGQSPVLGTTAIHATHTAKSIPHSKPSKFNIIGGNGTLTDSLGDTFKLTYTGNATKTGTTPIFGIQLKGTLTDGTGKYAGSTGTFIASGTENDVQNTFSLSFTLTLKTK